MDEDEAIEFMPESAAIKRVRWDGISRVMMVEFASGRRYEHDNVPREVVEGFRDAVSAGSYYNAEVKGRY